MRLFYMWLLVSLTGGLVGCRVTVPLGTLAPDVYQIIHDRDMAVPTEKVYILDGGDTLQLLYPRTDERRYVAQPTYTNWTFKRNEVDIDVFTLPFKIRPAQGNLPAQLNANFNAALYIGRRFDLYSFRSKQITPTYRVRQLRSRGFGYGVFTGLGAVYINDFVTKTPIGIEYEGIVVDVGVAAIYDARVFNVGLAVGLDHLMDQNRDRWIYQQRPWFGILFGLNLN